MVYPQLSRCVKRLERRSHRKTLPQDELHYILRRLNAKRAGFQAHLVMGFMLLCGLYGLKHGLACTRLRLDTSGQTPGDSARVLSSSDFSRRLGYSIDLILVSFEFTGMFGIGDLFEQAVHRMFSSWTALQLAVEHYEGRGNAEAKATWLENDTTAYFRASRSEVQIEDIEDCLRNFFNDEFNALIEDGSIEEISRKLVMFAHLARTEDVETFRGELNRLPAVSGANRSIAANVTDEVEMEDDSDMLDGMEDMSIREDDAGGRTGEPPLDVRMEETSRDACITSQHRRNEPDEEGFVVVAGNKSRRKPKI